MSEISKSDLDDYISSLGSATALYLSTKLLSLREYIIANRNQRINKLLTDFDKRFKKINTSFLLLGEKNFDKAFKKILKAEYVDLTAKQKTQMLRYKSLLLGEMNVPTNRLKRTFMQALIANQTEDVSQSKLLSDLNRYAPQQFKRHTRTAFNTYLQRTYARSTWESVKDDYQYYVYSGPKDSRNRDTCSKYANKVITRKKAFELMALRDGFYNCRHSIIPFTGTEEEARARLVA